MSTDALFDVAIVGAGPAGMAAAVAARRAGASVALIDEYAAAGGQIWRRGFAEVADAAPASLPRAGRALCAELAAADVTHLPGTAVWAAPDARTLLLTGPDGAPGTIRARTLVLATGAYDRPVAFPGWTLPGVLTAGAAQALAKGQGVLPGRRILLAGAGPFLLPVATQLAASGAEIVAVVEATRRRDWLAAAPRMAAHPARLLDYAAYRRKVREVVWGHVIVRADGDDRVRSATIAEAGPDWSPRSGTERSFAVDAVCTAYGFLPSVELARALGCELLGRAVAHDETMRTTVPGVYVAGEAAGIGGAALAQVEGELAGCAAAAAAGRRVTEGRGLRRRRAHLAGFASVLADLFDPRPGVLALADAETPLCRCEDVTAGAVDAAVAHGADTLAALKIVTRCGQGPCQGRICESLVAERAGTPERFSSRAPLRPVVVSALIQSAPGPEPGRL
jgi:thioredoxin reductase/bacterioferritin-associated ferredoxin